MTRARQQLIISHAESRRLYGREQYAKPSRFLREIPDQYLQKIRMQGQISRPVTAQQNTNNKASWTDAATNSGFSLGQQVHHSKFGDGVILQQEGEGPQARVQVNFESAGSKWLVVAFANLTSAS
jgi:DNA helicase-2/ATP-dependent DNA helicase PcrA